MFGNDPVPSETSSSSQKLDKFNYVKTSGSRIKYMYSSSGYTMSPCVVHSSGAAVWYPPQKAPNCKIVGVCTLCVYTLCVHCTVYTSSCTSNRILPNLGRFLLAGAWEKMPFFPGWFGWFGWFVNLTYDMYAGGCETTVWRITLIDGYSRMCCFRALKLVAGWRNHLAASVSPLSNLLDGFAVETVENSSNFRYTQCVYTVHSVYTDSLNFVYSVCTLCSGASKNVHP